MLNESKPYTQYSSNEENGNKIFLQWQSGELSFSMHWVPCVVVCMTLGNATGYLEYFMIFNTEWNMILNIYNVMHKD